MKKELPDFRIDSIPLPKTVADALTPVFKSDSSVSLTLNGSRTSEGEWWNAFLGMFDGKNVMFYLGKTVPLSRGNRVRRLLGWGEVKDPTYSDEVLKGMLDFCRRLDFQPRFTICPDFSRFFNGGQSMEGALSSEKMKEWIDRVGEGRLDSLNYPREVRNVFDVPSHRGLFSALCSAYDEASKQLAVGKAFDRDLPLEEATEEDLSLRLASLFYRVARENDRLFGAFSGARTSEQKDLFGDDPEHSSHYYALAEVAVRLTDLVQESIFIQGGIDRQGVYDDIIWGLLKGRKGRFKNVNGLEPWFKFVEARELTFSTIHLGSKDNYYARKARQTRARTRLGLLAAAGLAVSSGLWKSGYEQGQQDVIEKNEVLDEYLKLELEDVRFYWDTKFMLEPERNVPFFRESLVPSMIKDLGVRYGVDKMQMKSLQIEQLMMQHLLKHKSRLRYSTDDQTERVPLLDSFVKENEAYLLARGLKLGRPYQAFEEYREAFDATEALEWDKEVASDVGPPILAQFIGEFVATDRYAFNQELYVLMMGGTRYLVGRDVGLERYNSDGTPGPMVFSTKVGKQRVAEFRRSMKKYDAEPFEPYEDFSPQRVLGSDVDLIVTETDAKYAEHLPDYVDYYDGAFHYEVRIFWDWNEQKQTSYRVLVARDVKRGDASFSTQTAREMSKVLEGARAH